MKAKPGLFCVAVFSLATALEAAAPSSNVPRTEDWKFVPRSEITPEAVEHFGATTEKMLSALQKSDLHAFVLRGDDRFQKLSAEQFRSIREAWGPRLKAGFEIAYLGELSRSTAYTTIWRIRFTDAGEDAVLTLSAGKRGSVTSFVLN